MADSPTPPTPPTPTEAANTATVKPPATREYDVYEVTGDKPQVLTFVANVEAATNDAARWAAVEKVPALKRRVTAKEGKSGEAVPLIPIATRNLPAAVPTHEKVIADVQRT